MCVFRLARGWFVAAVVGTLGCGDAAPPVTDGSVDTGPTDTGAADTGPLVSPIAAAAAPDFGPCPSGWRSVPHPRAPDIMVCDPWPEGGPETCATHEFHLPGTPGCAPLGATCAADGWPADLPDADVVHVRAGSPPAGDGSRGAPFATIAEGIAAVPDGGVVAIAAGTYEGLVIIDRPMTLWGACAEGVQLYREGTSGITLVRVAATGDVVLRDLSLTSDKADLLNNMSADLSLRGVSFAGTGIIHAAGDILLERVASYASGDGTFSVFAFSGSGDATVREVVVVDADAAGMRISSDGVVSLSDVAVLGAIDTGIQTRAGTHARLVVSGATGEGISLDGQGSLEDVLIEDVAGNRARSVGLFATGELRLRRIRVERAGDAAVTLAYSNFDVADMLLVGGDPLVRDVDARGIEIGGGAVVHGARIAILDTADIGVLVDGADTSASLADLRIDDVRPAASGIFGRCLHAQQDAELTVERLAVSRCREAAATASYGASITLRDARIERTLPIFCETGACEDPRAGIGLVALEEGGRIDAERFVISEAALAGVQIVEGGETDLRDGTIESSPVGLNVQVAGYDISRLMDRVVFRDNGTNLDSTELPVPSSTVGVPAP